MSKRPFISIILPFKNEENYIVECLDSIVSQDYTAWELIAVDDHSDDGSPDIVKSYSDKYENIHYEVNNGRGVISALKRGLELAKGETITRMDADDIKKINNLSSLANVVAPGKIAIGLVKYFRADGLGDGYKYYEDWINELNSSGNTWKDVYRECVVPSPCWLVYKEDLLRSGSFDSDLYPEDYDLCLRFYRSGLIPVCTQNVIHLWRDHDIRTTRVSEHYSDSHFIDLKVRYFLEIDFNNNKSLVLWGAGKKAKKVAKLLNFKSISFRWVTNNSNKIGHDIYGVQLEDSDAVWTNENHQVILALAQTPEVVQNMKVIGKDTEVFRFF